jgi:hydrogenase-4 component B
MAGALLHVLNHATFKSLLFLAAGSAIHAAGTREIDRMGGLSRRLPFTSLFFLTGAVAICGLPPLNGFVSEFLIYLGFFTAATEGTGAGAAFPAIAAPALALVGGLAVACFVKVFGVVFLGVPRSGDAGHGGEAGRWMLGPMAALAAVCAVIGMAPQSIAGILAAAVSASHPSVPATAGAPALPFAWIAGMNTVLLLLGCGAAVVFAKRARKEETATAETWGCGYIAPTPRMQYTGSSFGEMLVKLFGGVLQPHRKDPVIATSTPAKSRFWSHVPETALEHIYLPALEWANGKLAGVRKLQNGQLHLYILYTFITLIVLIAWGI